MFDKKPAESKLNFTEEIETKDAEVPGLTWSISNPGGRSKQQVRNALGDIGLENIVLVADEADNHFAYRAYSTSRNVNICVAVTNNGTTHYMVAYNNGCYDEARPILKTAMDNLGHEL